MCPQQIHGAVSTMQRSWGSAPRGEAPWDGGLLIGGWALAPKSLQPRTAQITPNAQAQLTPKRLPHLLRKCSPSEVVGEDGGKEILVEGEVISFKLQGFSSRSFQVASAQHFTVFLEKKHLNA